MVSRHCAQGLSRTRVKRNVSADGAEELFGDHIHLIVGDGLAVLSEDQVHTHEHGCGKCAKEEHHHLHHGKIRRRFSLLNFFAFACGDDSARR